MIPTLSFRHVTNIRIQIKYIVCEISIEKAAIRFINTVCIYADTLHASVNERANLFFYKYIFERQRNPLGSVCLKGSERYFKRTTLDFVTLCLLTYWKIQCESFFV